MVFCFFSCASSPMPLPQELINLIVDAIVDCVDLAHNPWIITSPLGRVIRETLRYCALIARAFVRPCQMYIFHGLTLGNTTRTKALSALCLTRPHLPSYIRALVLECRPAEEYLESIMHILAAATNLTRLKIYPQSQAYCMPLHASLAAAFSLPYVRHIELGKVVFEDAFKLQALLSASRSLKTLTLYWITFVETTKPTQTLQIPAPAAPRVVLDSLKMIYMHPTQMQAMLDAFTVIDITQLRSLDLDDVSMQPLLKLNARTLQHIKICDYSSRPSLEGTVDADALARQLQSLHLEMVSPFVLNTILRFFGRLDHLMRLKTVRVRVSEREDPVSLRTLDGLLDGLPALAEAHVYASSQWKGEPDAEALLRSWMPVLAARGVLRIHIP
ncbi:hypothetical protein DFH09DRAFT_1176325 [Mycena vulgaris]|nr:hypothetical protein DFH09DRAFT_1176325 [Mycena vulgaris]